MTFPFNDDITVKERDGTEYDGLRGRVWQTSVSVANNGQQYDYMAWVVARDRDYSAFLGKGNRILEINEVEYRIVDAELHSIANYAEVALRRIKEDG